MPGGKDYVSKPAGRFMRSVRQVHGLFAEMLSCKELSRLSMTESELELCTSRQKDRDQNVLW